MYALRGTLTLLAFALTADAARAQIIVGRCGARPFVGRGAGAGFMPPRIPFNGVAGSIGIRSTVSVAGFSTPVGFGGFSNPFFVTPAAVVRPPVVLAGRPSVPVGRPPEPVEDEGNLIVITPRNRGGFGGGVAPPWAERAPVPRAEPGPGAPIGPPMLPVAPRPADGPIAEAGRLIDLGLEAFAEGAYGRAAERFGRAAEVDPEGARPQFLLAQARFALGKYRLAVEAVTEGLRLQPDWAAARFDPRGPYKDNRADFDAHLRQLRDALADSPDEPDLLFLLGYELWFGGDKDEAKRLLRRAKDRAADPAPIDRFLRAADGVVVMR
jgi:Flp pilus assembly protein TadD